MKMENDKNLISLSETTLKDKIYTIRGQRVMLDIDLAEIYGYETKSFNRQVKRNIERFDGNDFMFQLTKEEYEFLRCKNGTSSWGGSRYLPYAFTEQGIYMLMTVLRGDLAVRQSKALIRLFKAMKDYLIENQSLFSQKKYYSLIEKVEQNTEEITTIHATMITKADLSDIMKLFDQRLSDEELLILDGEPFKADIAYQKIYGKAKKSVIIVDDYVGPKTLRHLAATKTKVTVTVISDNKGGNALKLSDYNDFLTEYPGRTINFLKSLNRAHDRYIVIDNGSKDMKLYHCGASSKDAGKRITTITRIIEMSTYKATISQLLSNPALVLK